VALPDSGFDAGALAWLAALLLATGCSATAPGVISSDGGGEAGCALSSDCPASSSACVVPICRAGMCEQQRVAEGTVITPDAPPDCHGMVCDDTGHVVRGVDLRNVPTSSNPCVTSTCAADGTPGSVPLAAGAVCSSSAGTRCNGSGVCVQCLDDGDCNVGLTCVADRCVPSECADGVKDGSETDVDCGGGTCAACAVGKDCKEARDCASTVCDIGSGACVASTCDDQVKDGSETDVDCGGGICAACPDGKQCLQESDCTSIACNTITHVCVATTCSDGVKDGSETGVDCGGTCTPCDNSNSCRLGSDCASGFCQPTLHVCQAPSCSDGVEDGYETAVDCGGGECPGCSVGRACNLNRDCAANACIDHACVVPTCSDGVEDGTETGVDCGGGTCTACPPLQGCRVSSDCTTNDCEPTTLICLPATCTDGIKDGSETDVDCGGGICLPCPNGHACLVSSDCTSSGCDGTTDLCDANPCADHRKDNMESDVDCGGPICPACPNGDTCFDNFDCAAGVCTSADPHACEP